MRCQGTMPIRCEPLRNLIVGSRPYISAPELGRHIAGVVGGHGGIGNCVAHAGSGKHRGMDAACAAVGTRHHSGMKPPTARGWGSWPVCRVYRKETAQLLRPHVDAHGSRTLAVTCLATAPWHDCRRRWPYGPMKVPTTAHSRVRSMRMSGHYHGPFAGPAPRPG